MQLFNEWVNSRIKMSFQEKYNMLMQRLGTLNSMKTTADAAVKNKSGIVVAYCGGCGLNDKSAEEIAQEVDLMWDEIKKDILSAVKEQKKIEKK